MHSTGALSLHADTPPPLQPPPAAAGPSSLLRIRRCRPLWSSCNSQGVFSLATWLSPCWQPGRTRRFDRPSWRPLPPSSARCRGPARTRHMTGRSPSTLWHLDPTVSLLSQPPGRARSLPAPALNLDHGGLSLTSTVRAPPPPPPPPSRAHQISVALWPRQHLFLDRSDIPRGHDHPEVALYLSSPTIHRASDFGRTLAAAASLP